MLQAEIMAPAHALPWMRDREQLWNGVERAEKRKDSQLARPLIISLPHDLERGMIADLAVHKPDRDGDLRNVHAHVLLTSAT